MAHASNQIDIYVESGKKRTFAGAIEWPGWCRSGRDEASALQALFEYGPRYARALQKGAAVLREIGPLKAELERVKKERNKWRLKWLKERDRARDLQDEKVLIFASSGETPSKILFRFYF